MGNPVPFRRPVNWDRFRPDEAERVIHERAADTDNVIMGVHAYDRIEERSITQPDVYVILRTGHVIEAPQRNIEGDWEAVVEKRMPGGRAAGVVTIVFREEETLFVKTVEWIDPR